MTDRKSESERFWEKVNKTESCWIWIAGKNDAGYGVFKKTGSRTMMGSHRWSYIDSKGEIPSGLHVDHLCRVRSCVNPDHLELVTQKENTRRGISAELTRKRHAAITHCPYGHEYDSENTIKQKCQGYIVRRCKKCQSNHMKKYYLKRKGWLNE